MAHLFCFCLHKPTCLIYVLIATYYRLHWLACGAVLYKFQSACSARRGGSEWLEEGGVPTAATSRIFPLSHLLRRGPWWIEVWSCSIWDMYAYRRRRLVSVYFALSFILFSSVRCGFFALLRFASASSSSFLVFVGCRKRCTSRGNLLI